MSSNPAFTDALAKAKEIAARLSSKTAQPVAAQSSIGETATLASGKCTSQEAINNINTSSNSAASSNHYFQYPTTSAPAPTSIVTKHLKTTVEFSIPGFKVGLIIGAKGETLKRIERATDTRITFEPLSTPNPNDMPERRGFIVGLPDDCERARLMIIEKSEEATMPGSVADSSSRIQSSSSFVDSSVTPIVSPPSHRDPQGNSYPHIDMSSPNSKVGLCIGRGGETIRDLQERTGARIFIAPDSTPGASDPYANRPVVISGPESNIQLAKQLLSELLETGRMTGPSPSLGMLGSSHHMGDQDRSAIAGAGTTITLTVPDHLVGLLIGKRGEGMKMITIQSRARISVDPPFSTGSPTRSIYVSGTPESISIAQQLIHDRLSSAAALEGNVYHSLSSSMSPQSAHVYSSQQQAALTAPQSYTQEQLKQIYDYYLQYYLQAGCDHATACEAAKAAMIGAGIPPFVDPSSY